MYPFVRSGLSDGVDMRSIALLRQQQQLQRQHQHLGLPLDSNNSNHNVNVRNQLLSARCVSGTNQSTATDAPTMVCGGLSSSELQSAASLHKTERMMCTAELLKQHQHQQHLGREDQVAKAMALASSDFSFSMPPRNEQQHNPNSREDLILKRAINQLSMASRFYPMQQNHHNRSLHSHDSLQPTSSKIPMSDPNQHREATPLRCAHQNLSIAKDICFGRGQRVQRRKANVAFRKIVATYQETYDQAVSREDKKAVVKKVSRILTRSGFRFFKESEESPLYGDGSKIWVAVSDNDVEYKIGHSFRSGRKQIKQQQKNNQRKEGQIGVDTGLVGNSGSETTGNNTKVKKTQSHSTVENDSSDDECIFKENELPEHCICIGYQREKYTNMESYQYFREFILTFKSIVGMSESFDQKKKVVSSLIEQIKSREGYRFLKLLSMKTGVEFWIEASAHDIECEVFSILGNPLRPAEEKVGKLGPPKKRQRRLQDAASVEDCTRPPVVKRKMPDFEQSKKKEEKTTINGSSLTSNAASTSVSSATKLEASLPWKKGRKRTRPKAKQKVSSECNSVTNDKLKSGTDSIFKADREAMSATLKKGLTVPPSLSLSSVFFGGMTCDNFHGGSSIDLAATRGNLPLTSVASGEKMLQGRKGRQLHIPGFGLPSVSLASRSDTLGKALHAMRSFTGPPPNTPATRHSGEQGTQQQFEMRAKLLEHLNQQERLYFEKKHTLELLDRQLQSPDSRM